MTLRKLSEVLCTVVCVLALIPSAYAANTLQVPAFPGAEGYGSLTDGGRGGKVIAVTNLNASGPGSLQEACSAKGPRIIVFRVAGTIDGNVNIKNDHITIAGQTAPGDGITIKGFLGIGANDVIIRYIRVRTDRGGDTIGGKGKKNIILDHVSASWSTDEVVSIFYGENVTIQWSMITEACSGNHKFGGIWGNHYSTYHHNLIAHNTDRNPRIAGSAGHNDVRNNVIYNWKNESTYGGEMRQTGREKTIGTTVNLVANYYKPGPGTPAKNRTKICAPWSRKGADDYGKWYIADNYLEGHPEVTKDNWLGVFPTYYPSIIVDDRAAIPGFKLDKPWPAMAFNQQTAEEAYKAVLASAGCSLPNRDAIDARIVEEVRTGTATKGDNGFVSNQEEAGGWVEMKSGPVPADNDQDGMPDAWENTYGLNPHDAGDNALDKDNDGYTNIEEYLNGTNPTKYVDYSKPENNVNTLSEKNSESS